MAKKPVDLVPPPGLPTNSPTAVTWAVKAALVFIPILLTIWQPNGAFNSSTAQIWVVTGGIFAAAMIHLGEIGFEALKQFGFTKAALSRAETQGQQWIEANWTDVKDAFENAKGLVDAKDLLPKMAEYHNEVVAVRAKVAALPTPVDHTEAIKDINARLDTFPVKSHDDLTQAIDDEFKQILHKAAGGQS